MGVVSVVDGDKLGAELTLGLVAIVVVVVSVVDGDCAVRLEHAANPLLKKRAAIANPPHIFGGSVAIFAILRFSTGAALSMTEDLAWL